MSAGLQRPALTAPGRARVSAPRWRIGWVGWVKSEHRTGFARDAAYWADHHATLVG
ncbi:hypothetical protein PLANTIT3_50420 [Plantibacter sp. T3]|nr:hypothetical protein PLANTIT3_50420 [Plantibacter sp. T3]